MQLYFNLNRKNKSWPGAVNSVEHFLDYWLMWEGLAHCKHHHPSAGGPRLYRKASWVSHGESKPESATLPWSQLHSVLATRPLPWSPSLKSLHDVLWVVSPFLPTLLLAMMFLMVIERTPTFPMRNMCCLIHSHVFLLSLLSHLRPCCSFIL